MKKLLIALMVLISAQAFATGGVTCESESGKILVSGVVGAGQTLLSEITVVHSDLPVTLSLNATMKWLDYSKSEVKLVFYDGQEDVQRLVLKVENGTGTLSYDFSDMPGGEDLLAKDIKVSCEFE